MKIMSGACFAAMALFLAGAASAQGSLPPVQTFGDVRYVTGGVGLDEAEAIKAAEKDYTLALLFAQTRRNEFIADVKVTIRDQAGRVVLEALADGPSLLARLPAGAYTVAADYAGKVLVRKVTVDAKGLARTGFVWQPAAKATVE